MRALSTLTFAALIAVVLLLAVAASPASAVPNEPGVYRVFDCDIDLLDGHYQCPTGVTVVVKKDLSARAAGRLVLVSGDPVDQVTFLSMLVGDVADLGPMMCRFVINPRGQASGHCSN